MSDTEPKQLSMDSIEGFNQNPISSMSTDKIEIQSVSSDEEDDELDKYVNSRGCSYDEARRHLGLFPDTQTQSPVILKSESSINGVSINLSQRARYLANAIDDYSGASKADGMARAIEINKGGIRNKFGDGDMIRARERRERKTYSANSEFAKAFGHKALIDAGYDPTEIGEYFQDELESFTSKYAGSGDNAKARRKLKNFLEKRY